MAALPSQRHLFDIPDGIAYFNCAYNSPQLNATRDRLHAGVRSKSHPWERTAADFFDDADTLRRLACAAFGGEEAGYAIIPAASYGLSTAARAIEPQLRRGDSILVIDEAFPSNYLPWERTARVSGADLVTVPTPADGDWTGAILGRIDRRVKVVAVPNCHWTNGALIDLKAVGAACREVGALLAVDATQSLGAMALSIEQVQPDFLVAAGYKWLLCPYGFGLLYVAERWRDARPLEESWLARDNAADFTALVRYCDTYRPGARRFDVGEACVATLLPGAIAALEHIKAWQVDTIAETLSLINGQIAGHLEQLGFRLPPAALRSPHLFGARLPEDYRGELVSELRARGIFISQRGNALRFAPHLHVTQDDVGRLLDAVGAIIGQERRRSADRKQSSPAVGA